MEDLRAEQKSRSSKRNRGGKDNFFLWKSEKKSSSSNKAWRRHEGAVNSADLQKKILRDISCANTLNKEWIIPCSGTEREVIQQKELGIAVERTHAH